MTDLPSPARRRSPAGRFPAWTVAAAFLLLEAAACARALTPRPEAPEAPPAPPTEQPAPPQAPAPDTSAPASFPQPIEVQSVNGLLDVRMQVVRASFNVPGGGSQSLRAYQLLSANGKTYNAAPAFPGPTFRVKPGDRVRVKLLNGLENTDTLCMNYPAANSGLDTFPDCFHGPDWTNMHFHGFHVTPADSGDNVLLEIAPQDSFQYSFRIPQNQSPGTHWYHPHKHGSVAIQVTNGMSGAFFIEDPTTGLDSMTRAYGMEDYLVAIQQVDSSVNLVDNNTGNYILVNGQQTPVLSLRAGEVARLRMVNENISQTAHYQIIFPAGSNNPSFYDVARDGVQFAPANYDAKTPDDSLYMAPGNRLDVFVKAPGTAGDFTVRARQLANVRSARRQSRKVQEQPQG
ncbi:MAG: multicopper oxidase domain-containing protein, partial [Gemmatimonadetes bacterium]|nr:multicopper oxidase domain-containing protein [Gemmatimonadota bacterium]